MNFLISAAMKEVMALGIARIEARKVGTGKCTFTSFITLESKCTWVFWKLVT
jgi:hypothetical protein